MKENTKICMKFKKNVTKITQIQHIAKIFKQNTKKLLFTYKNYI